MKLNVQVKEQQQKDNKVKILGNEKLSKSEKIRQLMKEGFEFKEIATMLGIRYNMVYNIGSDYIRREGLQDMVIKKEKGGKKDEIVKLLKEGKTPTQVSELLKTNRNYIYRRRKEEVI